MEGDDLREGGGEYYRDVKKADTYDDALFASLFNRGVKLLGFNNAEAADFLGVSRTTVTLWRSCKNLAHPLIRKSILVLLALKLAEH